LLCQVRHRVELLWVACNQSALFLFGKNISDIVFVGELFHITEDLGFAEVGQGVLDPSSESLQLEAAEVPSGRIIANSCQVEYRR
jgi:hypothetical protein